MIDAFAIALGEAGLPIGNAAKAKLSDCSLRA
jgi:hypothetical protein